MHGESDLELRLVVELPEGRSYYRHVADIRSLFWGMLVPVDLFVPDRATFEAWKDTPEHLAYAVAHHGRRLDA